MKIYGDKQETRRTENANEAAFPKDGECVWERGENLQLLSKGHGCGFLLVFRR